MIDSSAMRVRPSKCNFDFRWPRGLIRPILTFVLCACFFLLPACRNKRQSAHVPNAPQPSRAASRPTPAKPLAVSLGYSEEGIASWYGVPYHGRPAANGEIYNMETLVAAHRLLPFNTWLKVTNLANDKSVSVRVIDRGPFVEGRIIDLSKAAARQIDLLGPGIGRVRLEVIGAPVDIPADDLYAVQVGAFSVRTNAERVRLRYAERFGSAQLALKQGAVPLWRVLVGKEPSVQAAQQLATQLSADAKAVFVVRLDQQVSNALKGSGAAAAPALAAAPEENLPPTSSSATDSVPVQQTPPL